MIDSCGTVHNDERTKRRYKAANLYFDLFFGAHNKLYMASLTLLSGQRFCNHGSLQCLDVFKRKANLPLYL